jgi:GSH-dependent disulfide-bond oxidoreductase
MIDLYFFPSPNTWKASIMLEECGLRYRVRIIDITKDEQQAPDFLKISPNGRVPAIVDLDAPEGPRSVFESGAILIYLAEKTKLFLAASGPERTQAMEWLFWQIGGLGPMAGQAHHFRRYATEGNAYAVERYTQECTRLYGVLDRRLARRDWIAGGYSIADMACWGWVWFHRLHGQLIDDFDNIKRWFLTMSQRPAVQRAKQVGLEAVQPATKEMLEGAWYAQADEFAKDETRVR